MTERQGRMTNPLTEIEDYEPSARSSQSAEEDELDTTPNWVPLTLLIIAVPLMLGLFILFGYLIL